jgi:hypothetical protein
MIAPQKPVMWNGSDSLPATQLVSHSSSAVTIYGGPLRLASAARRFDVSPRGTPALPPPRAVRLLAQVSTQSLHRHALRPANRFRAGIGLEPGDSAIVSPATDGDAAEAMAAARITGSARAGRLRLSFTSPPPTKTPTSPPTSCGGTSLPATQPRCDGRSYPGPDRPDLYGSRSAWT